MHIVYVTAQTPWGREEFILPEILALREQGHRVTAIPLRPERELAPGDEACEVAKDAIRLPLLGLVTLSLAVREGTRRPFRVAATFVQVLAATSGLKKKLKNVVVFPKALALARIVRLLRADHIHAHWASTSSTAAYIASRISGIPWSMTAHRWDIAENNMLKEKVRAARFVRAINARGRREIIRIVGNEMDHKVDVIHMGVKLPDRSLETLGSLPIKSSERRKVVVCPANFVPVKGHQYLLRALAQLRATGVSFTCWLFGTGPLEGLLRQEQSRLDLTDCVEFKGRLPHDELLRLFFSGAVDIVVLPSIVTDDGAYEGIPVSLMEAMAAGIPVIATRTGGIPELVEGVGILVEPKNPTQLASAIRTLIEDERLREETGKACFAKVAREFALDVVSSRLAEKMLFENQIKQRDLDRRTEGTYASCH